jgi:hypothetical protein
MPAGRGSSALVPNLRPDAPNNARHLYLERRRRQTMLPCFGFLQLLDALRRLELELCLAEQGGAYVSL